MSSEIVKPGYRPCVGIMVLNAEGHVWIGHRADAPGEPEGPGSWWQMPQGGIEEGEDPRTAAFRELAEETAMRSVEIIDEMPDWVYYDLPAELQGKAWGGRWIGQRQRWFAMRFTGPDTEINIVPPAGRQVEFDRWRWTPFADLVGIVVPFKRSVYEEVAAYFAPLSGPSLT